MTTYVRISDRWRMPVRARLALPFAMLAIFLLAPGVRGQTTDHAGLQRAIAAYESGDLPRSLAILDSLPVSLPAREQAIRNLYRGLIHFAVGDTELALAAFAWAIQLDPYLHLDAEVHSPSRVSAFQEAVDSVTEEWRRQAWSAESLEDWAEARRTWTKVVSAIPADTLARRRLAAIREIQAEALVVPEPARSSSQTEPHAVTQSDTAATIAGAAARRFDPGQAALLGMVMPGLGQIYAGRPGRGVLVLGAAAGSLAVGLLRERVSVECLTVPVANHCPPEDVVSENTERPFLLPGIGAAVAVTLIGAIDAYLTARSANSGVQSPAGERRVGRAAPRLEVPAIEPTLTHLRFELVRVRF